MLKARITATGSYAPEQVFTNKDLEKMINTTDQWITDRTGIRERHVATPEQAASDLAVEAAKIAIARAGCTAEDLDMIICATVSGDMPFPSTACFVQGKLGAVNAVAFDIAAACSGFIYGLSVAEAFIKSGVKKRILLVGVEVLTKYSDWNDRSTCVLFGDGAGAVIIEPSTGESGILHTDIASDGNLTDLIQVPGGGSRMPCCQETVDRRLHFIRMKGNETFKVAVKTFEVAAIEILEKTGVKPSELALFIPHQANLRIIQAVAKRLELPDEKIIVNIDRYGNTSAASIPIALDEVVTAGRIKEGDYILLEAFGAGLTWGASVIRW
jgi:3-oxoacyl-[acyl-carrier-protein] synthase-3